MPKKTAAKTTPVTKKFLLNLAKDIYDPQTRRFMRLCNGVLQNGPDPTNKERPMHCGLGELYFAMTGHQPQEDGISEADVVDLAVERSELKGEKNKTYKEAIKAIKELNLNSALEEDMLELIEEKFDNDVEDVDEAADDETAFRCLLNAIPDTNDGVEDCHDGTCSFDTYRTRSAAVARQLREAAKFLP